MGRRDINEPVPLIDGRYYWARDLDRELIIVYRDGGDWFMCGVGAPVSIEPAQIMCPVAEPLQ